jgi:hypothetical protein
MNADLPGSPRPQTTPQPDDPLGANRSEVFSTEYSSGEFPYLPPTTDSAATEVVGLNVVIDPPTLRVEPSGCLVEGEVRPGEIDKNGVAAPGAGTAWPSMLLFSYASAVTLALVWILWTGRRLPPSRVEIDEPPRSAPEIPSDFGAWDVSTDDAPPAPLPPQNLTSLGEPIRLGSVELTPLVVERRALDLFRAIDPEDSRQSRKPSLLLRVRLKNLSADRTFAPLELSSVRECLGIRNETFLESERGRIGMYPLALESEWSIVGQRLPSLGPGESAETFLATAAITEDKLGEALTWYARLRVTSHQTDVVGVTFARNEIVDE